MKEKILVTDHATYTITSYGEVFTESIIKTPIGTSERKFSGEFTYTYKGKREMTYAINNRGYKTVRMDGGKTKMIHRLVAEAFIPNPDNKPFVNHIDGNKLNNCLDNLEWCTNGENVKHAISTGLRTKEAHEKCIQNLVKHNKELRMPDADIAYIRSVFKKRCPEYGAQALAAKFGVSTVTISYIVNRRKHYA